MIKIPDKYIGLIVLVVIGLNSAASVEVTENSFSIDKISSISEIPETSLPVIIKSDEDVASAADSGSGTIDAPFIVSGRTITSNLSFYLTYKENDRTRTTYPCIGIMDTTVYIFIRDCTLFSNNDVWSSRTLFLYNNSHVSVEDTVLTGGEFVVFIAGDMRQTTPVIIGDYSFSNCIIRFGGTNAYGKMLAVEYIQSISLYGCRIINSWDVFPSFKIGVDIIVTPFVMMRSNKFIQCGVHVDGPPFDVLYDIDTSNMVDDAPILWIANQTGFTLDGKLVGDAGQIYVTTCSDFTIQNFDVEGGSFPVETMNCTKGWIRHVHASRATWDGISVTMGSSVSVEHCLIELCSRGGIIYGGVNYFAPGFSIVRHNIARNCGRNLRFLISTSLLVEKNVAYVTADLIDLAVATDPTIWLYGIETQSVPDLIIKDNTIFDVTHGIITGSFYGNPYGGNISIIGNFIESLDLIEHPFVYATGIDITSDSTLVIENNYVTGFYQGMNAYGPSGTIRYNEFYQNSIAGLVMYGSGFTIFGNNFIDNGHLLGEQAFESYMGANNWSLDGTGNYWSDYEARYPEATHDGFTWDSPYELSGGFATDEYPLVNVYRHNTIKFALMMLKAWVFKLRAIFEESVHDKRENVYMIQLDMVGENVNQMEQIHDAGNEISMSLITFVCFKIYSIAKVAKANMVTEVCNRIF